GAAALGVGVFNAPWLFVFDAPGKTTLAWSLASTAAYHVRIATYLGTVERHLFPALGLAVVLGVTIAWRCRGPAPALPRGLDAAALLVVFAVVHLLVLSLAPVLFARY